MSFLISFNKVKARKSQCTKHFNENLCAINNGGEFENKLELKIKHRGNHAFSINLSKNLCQALL